MSEKTNNQYAYIAIVAIVAIVALVMLFGTSGEKSVVPVKAHLDNSVQSNNAGGQALRSSGTLDINSKGNTMYSTGCIAPPASECERCCAGYDSDCVTRCKKGAAEGWQ